MSGGAPAYVPPTHRVPIYQEPIGPSRPSYPTYTAGPQGQVVHFDPSLYRTPPVPARRPAAPASPTDPLWKLYQQAMASIETPAQAEARVKREVDEWTAAQQKLIGDAAIRQRQDALAAMQAMDQAGAAAAAMSKGLIGAVGGEYNAAAGEISGLAGGLTKSFNKGTAADVKAANAALGNVSAPALTQGGLTGYGGGLQAGVENYRGGTIPSQLLTTAGDAATFGLAGETAAQNLKVTQEAQAAYQSLIHDINNSEMNAMTALAQGEMDKAHDWLQEANDSRTKAITLASGLYTARQGLLSTKPITQKVGNTMLQYDPRTGQWKPVASAPEKLVRFTGSDGRAYILNPDGTAKLVPGQAGPKKPTQKNLVYKTLLNPADGKLHLYGVDGVTGERKIDLGPTGQKPSGTPKGPTANTVTKAQNLIKEWFYGYKVVGQKLDKKGNPVPNTGRRVPAYQAPGFDETKPTTYGKGWQSYPQALAQLTRMGFDRTAARNMLNQYWAWGDRGRPIFSSEQATALTKHFGKSAYERMLVAIRKLLNANTPQATTQAENARNMMLGGRAFTSATSALANFPG